MQTRICLACLVLALGLAGCEQEAAATSGGPTAEKAGHAKANPPQAAHQDASPAAQPPKGQSSYDETAFQIELEGPTQVKVGEEVALSLVLTAKGGFKVNVEYPLKFKLVPTSGIEVGQEVVGKDSGKIDDHQAELPIKVKATQSGALDVAGRLSFSVCTEDRCLIERRDLKITLTAS